MKYNKLYQVKQKLALLLLLTPCLSYGQRKIIRLYEADTWMERFHDWLGENGLL